MAYHGSLTNLKILVYYVQRDGCAGEKRNVCVHSGVQYETGMPTLYVKAAGLSVISLVFGKALLLWLVTRVTGAI